MGDCPELRWEETASTEGQRAGGGREGRIAYPGITLSYPLPPAAPSHPTLQDPLSPRQPVSPLQLVPKIELSLAQLNTNYRLAKPQITGLYFTPSSPFAFQMQPYP